MSKLTSRVRWSSLCVLVGALLCLAGAALAGGKALEGVVNINQASAAELQLLTGVGPAKAERIIAYRQKHPFRTVEELGRVKGIGPRTVRKLRGHLTVSGPTTARVAPAKAAPAASPVPLPGATAPASAAARPR